MNGTGADVLSQESGISQVVADVPADENPQETITQHCKDSIKIVPKAFTPNGKTKQFEECVTEHKEICFCIKFIQTIPKFSCHHR